MDGGVDTGVAKGVVSDAVARTSPAQHAHAEDEGVCLGELRQGEWQQPHVVVERRSRAHLRGVGSGCVGVEVWASDSSHRS